MLAAMIGVGLVTSLAGAAWLIAVAPAAVSFGLAVAAAMAWCAWLERHPEPAADSRATAGGEEAHGRDIAGWRDDAHCGHQSH
jgi:hypothetical protein